MNPFIAIIALGLDAARIAFQRSKIEKKAVSAVAAAVLGADGVCARAIVGIGHDHCDRGGSGQLFLFQSWGLGDVAYS